MKGLFLYVVLAYYRKQYSHLESISLCVIQFRQLVEIVQCCTDQLPDDELAATNVKPEALNLFK